MSTKGTKAAQPRGAKTIKNPVIPGGLGRSLKKEIIRNMPTPTRSFQVHLKIAEPDSKSRIIEGYASTKDLDRTGEIVEPGAFADSITEFMANPVLTYMHDWSNPIGKVLEARIDEIGLFVRAEVSETAEKIWKLMREGILRAFSIGYEVVEEKAIGGINHILRLRLYEVAVVSIPANRRSLFSVAKALTNGTDLVCNDCAKCAEKEIVHEGHEGHEEEKMDSRVRRDFSDAYDFTLWGRLFGYGGDDISLLPRRSIINYGAKGPKASSRV